MIRTTIFALLAGTAMAGAAFAQEAVQPDPQATRPGAQSGEAGQSAEVERQHPLMGLDTDGDGRISRAEAEVLGQNPMAAADTNGDGIVSREEVIAQAVERATRRAEAQAGQMFDRYDEDGDGQIAIENLPEPRNRGDRATRLFERADTNGDGFLSAEELENLPMHGMRGHHGDKRGHHGKGTGRGDRG